MAQLRNITVFLESLIQEGALERRLELPEGSSEEAALAGALNNFLDQLWLKDFQLSAQQEMLEKVVELRTREVHEILDNVSSGFLIALSDEVVLDNYSRSCTNIFGRDDLKGRKISELIGLDERDRANFSACYSQIFEDFLPIELALDQLPSEFTHNGRSYRIHGAPLIGTGGKVTRVFFTITDTTELRRAESENATRRALLEIVRQRENFEELLFETNRAFRQVEARPTQHAMRALLHTLKGNLGIYGLHEIAALIHAIEDFPQLTLDDLRRVEDAIRKFMTVHKDVLGLEYQEHDRRPRSVPLVQVLPLLDLLASGASDAEKRSAVSAFRQRLSWIPAGGLLAPLGGLVERLGLRLEKDVAFSVFGRDVAVDPERVGPVFSSLVHLIRNSLDHGIEAPDQRGDKPSRATIFARVSEDPRQWVLEVGDDGRGIDGQKLLRVAVAKGLVSPDEATRLGEREILRLIFVDGLSTKEEADMLSGRGVGAAAVLSAVEAIGGDLEIKSIQGRGTTFVMRLPKSAVPAPAERAA